MSNIKNVAARADDFFFERLEQEALHVRLREAVDDRHPVNFFVVLRFHVEAGEVLEDRRADLDAITVRERLLADDLIVVHVGAVRRVVVDGPPDRVALFEVAVLARDRVAFEDDLILAAATHTAARAVEDEPFAEECGLFRIDHDQAVVSLRLVRAVGLRHDRGYASLLVGVSHQEACRLSPKVVAFCEAKRAVSLASQDIRNEWGSANAARLPRP
jgi:hypothetical protein